MSDDLVSRLEEAAHAASYTHYIGDKKHYAIDLTELRKQFLRRWIIVNPSTSGQACPTNGSLFFLFYKNSSVTNIQYSELVALIRTHSTMDDASHSGLIFSSTAEYETFISNLWESYFGDVDTRNRAKLLDAIKSAVANITKDYGSVIRSTVILDIQYTSAILHVPRSIHVDVKSVTLKSGYVHSSGPALYVRNINKSSVDELLPVLRAAAPKSGKLPLYLVPYADELFRVYETGVTSTRNGLDGVSLKLRKHFIGGQPIGQLLTLLASDPDCSYVVPAGLADFRTERKAARVRDDCSIWFVSDSSLEPNSRDIYVVGDKLYFICYKQYYLNNNPLLIFKERKPAWFASTTLPHSLSRAMINVCRPNLPKLSRSRPLRVIDPFAGTGTTLIDVALTLPNSQIIGVDIDPLSPLYIRDNIDFLSFDPSRIEQLRRVSNSVVDECEKILDRVPIRRSALKRADDADKFRFAFELIKSVFQTVKNRRDSQQLRELNIDAVLNQGFPTRIRKTLLSIDLETRMFFYLIWRAIVMNAYTVTTTGKAGLIKSIVSEYKRFSLELAELYESRVARIISESENISVAQGLYSYFGTHSGNVFTQIRARFEEVQSVDKIDKSARGIFSIGGTNAIDVLRKKPRYFDLILGDPPYGFNEGNAQSREIQQLYADFVDAAIEALAEGGSLIVSVPAFARNGKQVPFYQTKDGLIPQVLAAANRRNREIARIANSRPTAGILVGPPYYWGSTATISRNVIHFVVR